MRVKLFETLTREIVLFGIFLLWSNLGACWAQSIEEFRQQLSRQISDYRFEEALETGRAGLALYPDQPHLQVTVGLLSLQMGAKTDGERLLRRALSREELDPELLLILGQAKLSRQDYDAAVAILKRGRGRGGGQHRFSYLLARAYLQKGQDERALESIEAAVKSDPRATQYRTLYAFLLDRQGRRDESLEQLKWAQRNAPSDARLLLALADLERKEERLGRAVEYLELSVEADPENPLYRRELAKVYRDLGLEEESQRAKAKAASLEAAFEAYARSLEFASRAEFDQAIEILEAEVKANPEFMTGAVQLADLLRKRGRLEEAFQLYDEILEKDPRQIEVSQRQAWMHLEQGELSKALISLYEADPQDPNVYLLEGYRKQLEGDWEEAMDYFREAERHYPLEPALMRQISLCLNSIGRPQEALDYLQKAYRVRPGDPEIERDSREIRFEYGLKLEEEEKWQAAFEIFDRLVLEQGLPEYYLHRAYSQQKLGRLDEAVDDYLRGLEEKPDAEWARMNLANCYYFLSLYQEATAQWEYLQERSDNPQYVYELGLSLIRQWKLHSGWDLVRRAARDGYLPARRLLRRAGLD